MNNERFHVLGCCFDDDDDERIFLEDRDRGPALAFSFQGDEDDYISLDTQYRRRPGGFISSPSRQMEMPL